MTLIKSLLRMAGRPIWTVAGVVSVAIGAVGVVLPVLPPTPFVILGAFCFAKGSPQLAHALEQNRIFGPMITDWRAYGAIAPRYKLIAHGMMAAALLLSVFVGVSVKVLLIQIFCMAGASAYILTRPSDGRPPE